MSTTDTTTVNRLWFKAITGELVAQWKFGMTSRNGSPMAQFRRVFPDFPRNADKAKAWLKQLMADNPELHDASSITLKKYFNEQDQA